MLARLSLSLIAGIVMLSVPVPAQAQQALLDARGSGIVGERYDGYLGFAGSPSQAARSQASAVNIKRRALYIALGKRRGVLPQVAGLAAGCELLGRVAVGEAYLLSDGIWRRRQPGEAAPVPAQCQGR